MRVISQLLADRLTKRDLIEKLIEEKDTQIRLLAAEVDWLRAQLGRPSLPAMIKSGTVPDDYSPPQYESAPTGTADGWPSERAEAEAILAREGVSAVHLPEILDALGVSELN